MPTVSIQKMMDALANDPGFLRQPSYTWDLMKSYTAELPELLKHDLTRPVTLVSLAEAKIAFLEYLLANDFCEAMKNALPEKIVVANPEAFEAMVTRALKMALRMVRAVHTHPEEFLRYQKMNEEQALISLGLDGNALLQYLRGRLTIGTLLEVKPWIIIDNGSESLDWKI